ncbi:hypothetical protein QAD02_005025 [Eretmocerus hayati]|uniref:Uncharacterized protein n=1 Tax=Eretmocerus hayati TaxID=131215 RepID=A0ACC2NRD4_9HYME|nr:hypothetical protein QAD02_005025 [Eretmocerus hayati]
MMADLEEDIYLIGFPSPQITSNKLPTNEQVLRVLMFNTRHCKLSLKDSIVLAIKEVAIFYEKAGIPMRRTDKCQEKLDKLYKDYRKIQKSSKRPSHKAQEDEFVSKLGKLFDVACVEGVKKRGGDKELFLVDQQSDHPRQFIGGIDLDICGNERGIRSEWNE